MDCPGVVVATVLREETTGHDWEEHEELIPLITIEPQTIYNLIVQFYD